MSGKHMSIAVTGLAAISPAGVGTGPLREALKDGKSRLEPVPEEIAVESGTLWGKVRNFKVSDYMPPLKARKFDRCSLFAVIAAGMALRDAGIDTASADCTRIGIVLGCGFGGIVNSEEFLRSYFTRGAEGLAPMLFPNTVPNAPASNASIEHGLKGPNVTFVQRFCSAESAFMMACRFLQEDRADIMLTGGVDELNPLMMRAFGALGQLRRHAKSFSEGAGILVLEKTGHAKGRNADILAEIGDIRTIGRLVKGREAEGMSRLLGAGGEYPLVSLSGVAEEMEPFPEQLASAQFVKAGRILGRSLAMGGLSMISLVLSMSPGQNALHLAASPEGPYYAIDFRGGPSVRQ
jgi:3-oxoacyl-(acyl-carrier-protein) synthase